MAKLAWVGCLLAAAGCTSGPLEGGRYTCSRDAGESVEQPQCPQNWRCGIEGFCHELGDTKRPWLCELDADCEGGWSCGLSSSRAFRECHNPQSETPAFACAADTDCVQQWRCGLEGICHSPTKAAAYVCRSDAGLSDTWCADGWRCTPEGLCTDPRADALREQSLPAFPPGTLINPGPSIGPVSSFSVSQVYSSGIGARLQTVAWVQDGGLNAFVVDRTGAIPPRRYAIPGSTPLTFGAHGTRGEFQVGTQTPLAEPETQLFVISGDGGLFSIALEEDGGTASRPMTFPAIRRLSQGTAGLGLTPRMVGFDPDPGISFIAASGPTSRWANSFNAAVGGDFKSTANNRVLDVASMRAGLDREVIFAVDERGLWMMDRTVFGMNCFLPTQLPPLTRPFCVAPQPVTHRPMALRPLGINDLGVQSRPLDGGFDFLTHVDVSQVWEGSYTCSFGGVACSAGNRVPVNIFLGPCRACPSGQLIDFSLVQGKPAPRFELSCSGPDGGAAEHFAITAGTGLVPTCTREVVSGESSLFGAGQTLVPEQGTPGVVSYSDGLRNIWAGPNATTGVSLVLSRVPNTVVRTAAGEPFMLSEFATGVREPGVGFFEHPGVGAISGVVGQPSWVVLKDGQVVNLAKAQRTFESDLLAKIGPLPSFQPPFAAVHARTGTGTKALVVTSGFGVLAGEVEDPPLAGQVRELPLRFTASGPIRSIAFPAAQPTAGYLGGYAIAGGTVIKLTANAPHSWSSVSIDTPSELVPLEVWFDVERARVGFDDGTVYSLPSRVAIAPPLEQKEEVIDFVQVCGQQLALGSRKLYRLEPVAGKSVGVWAPLTPTVPTGFGAEGFQRGRAHAVGNTLYVFTRGGDAVSWTISSCP